MLPTNFISQLSERAYQFFGSTYSHTAQNQFLAIQPMIDTFIEPLDPGREKILDLGCGPGLLLEHLVSKGFKYLLGLDISDKAIQEAVKRVPAHMLLKQDFHQMNFHQNEFSVIFAINSLCYTSKEAIKQILQKIHFITRERGRLFIILPHGTTDNITEETYFDPLTNEEHKHAVYHSHYLPEEIKGYLHEAGFEVTLLNEFSDPAFHHPVLHIQAQKIVSIHPRS